MLWLKKRKLKKMLKGVRQLEIDVVNSHMEKIYNPLSVMSKPKYRQRESPEESELTRQYIHMIYDPPIKPSHRQNHTLDEYMKGQT